jgi:hypothetical protein
MKDLSGKLDRLRVDAKDCALMGMSATNPRQREMFERLADQLAIEALELEQIVKRQNEHLDSNEQHNVVDFNVCSERERSAGARRNSLVTEPSSGAPIDPGRSSGNRSGKADGPVCGGGDIYFPR